MKTKDEILVEGKFCKPHRISHFGKLHINEHCHFHKSVKHQIHHVSYCKLKRCPNYTSMIEARKGYKTTKKIKKGKV